MTTPESVLDTLVAARLDQAPALVRGWFSRDALEANLRRFLAAEVERMHSDALAASFAHHCPVPGAVPDDYKARWTRLPGFGMALVGIRFRGLDLARPFVAVVASESLPADQAVVDAALVVLWREFQVFAPRHLRVFLPPESALAAEPPAWFWEKRILAGRISELLTRPRPVGWERVVLKAPREDGWYERYRTGFEQLVEHEPELLEYTRMEEGEDLAALAANGTLFEIEVDGRWAGLTAVDVDGREGVEGYLMIEVMLAPHAWGLGLGASVHRRLVERLPDRQRVLLGEIDVRNLPALRAAAAAGRVDVGGYLWAHGATL